MIAERWVIGGRVQGVGFRDWLVAEARRRSLDGWVRNRADGSVEAVVAGPADAVGTLRDACRRGPPSARVSGLATFPAERPENVGFRRLPTVNDRLD